jgi:putative ABC transport system substrate-binding protein
MRRRDFLALVGGATTLRPLAGATQQKAMPVVGWLHAVSWGPNPTTHPIHQGLSEMGYVEGQNYASEYRAAEGHYDRLPALAADLVSRKVDLIVTNATPGILAAARATSTIPIVFTGGGDLVADGLIAGLGRPGGNLTGIMVFANELTPKRLDLLRELVPHVRVVALLVNPNNQNTERTVRDVQEAAREKDVQLHVLQAGTESEIDAAFSLLDQIHVGALVVASRSSSVGVSSSWRWHHVMLFRRFS